MKRTSNRTRSYFMAGGSAIALVGLAALWLANPSEAVDRRHCIIGGRPAKTVVFGLDASDLLIATQPREIEYQVKEKLAALKKGDRIVVLDAAGKPPAEVQPIVDQCVPGDEDNIARNAFKRDVLAPIEDHLLGLTTRAPTTESPLVETILSVAADASLHQTGSQLTVVLATDGLQNSDYYSAYRRGSRWPTPQGAPLKGVTIEIFLMKNERDFSLQPRAAERFAAWLRQAGASVSYTAPAWLMLADVQKKRGRR